MYVFKDFNRAHAARVRTLVALSLGSCCIIWPAATFLFNSCRTSLVVTLAILLVLHVVMIWRLVIRPTTQLSTLQYAVSVGLAVGVGGLCAFAAVTTNENAPPAFWTTFRSILLSLSLASYLSVYVDFAVGSLLVQSHRK